MGTKCKVKLRFACWKRHTCIECGSTYRYRLQREVSGEGEFEHEAELAAKKALVTAMGTEVDMRACPTCGAYQPDMLSAYRRRRHWILLWVALVGLATLLILSAIDFLAADTTAWSLVLVGAAILACHFFVAASDPNSDLEVNRAKAARRVRDGHVEQLDEKVEHAEFVDRSWSGMHFAHWILFGLMTVSVIALGAAELLRMQQGWPKSAGCYPMVVGPGDQTKVYFPMRIRSIKGQWRGRVQVQIPNREVFPEERQALVAAESKGDMWGEQIRAESSERASSSRLWAILRVANRPELRGKRLNLALKLSVTYPAIMANDRFTDRNGESSRDVAIAVAPAGAAKTYQKWRWWGGTGGAAGLVVLSSVLAMMAGSLRKLALPTSVEPIDAATASGHDAATRQDQ